MFAKAEAISVRRTLLRTAWCVALTVLGFSGAFAQSERGQPADAPSPVTTGDPEILFERGFRNCQLKTSLAMRVRLRLTLLQV
jgi:hypothetical protein